MTHFASLLLEKGGLGLVYPGKNHVLTENVERFLFSLLRLLSVCCV